MKHFTSKTVEDAVQAASKAVGIPAEQLIYKVIEEKKGLFGIGKEATIEIYDIDDAAAFAEEYLKTALGGMGVEAETSSNIDEDIIHVNINSERNPILIGKGGRTLQALNELARLAVSNKFRHRYRILLDVGEEFIFSQHLIERTIDHGVVIEVSTRYDVQGYHQAHPEP